MKKQKIQPEQKATHSPGPWEFGRTKPIPGVRVDLGWFISPAGKGLDIAQVHLTASQDEKTQEANARLIAAAPEIYEHALMVVRLFGTEHPKGQEELREAVKALREALGKAAA